MANLLPIKAQKKVGRARLARLIIVVSFVSGALGVLTLLVLAPSFMAFGIIAPIENVSEEKKPPSDAVAAAARTKAIITNIAPIISSDVSPSKIIKAALSVRPQGVIIDSISYSQKKLTIVGVASREGVNAYRDALGGLKVFSSISVPVGALVGTKSGNFTITLSGDF